MGGERRRSSWSAAGGNTISSRQRERCTPVTIACASRSSPSRGGIPKNREWGSPRFVIFGPTRAPKAPPDEAFRQSAERNRVNRCGPNSLAWIRDSFPSSHRQKGAAISRERRDRHLSRASDNNRRS